MKSNLWLILLLLLELITVTLFMLGYLLIIYRDFKGCKTRVPELFIYGVGRRDHVRGLLKKLHWLPIWQRIIFKVLCLIFKCVHGTAPSYLSDILPLRDENRFVRIPRTKTSYGDQAFSRLGPMYWNALPTHIRTIPGLLTFKSKINSSDYFTQLNKYRNWIPQSQLI